MPRLTGHTLIELLNVRASEHPKLTAYRHVGEDGRIEQSLTYGALQRRARVIGTALREKVAAGERALLIYPPGLDFLEGFFGCLYAGVIAVPAFIPTRMSEVARLLSIVRSARPALVLGTRDVLAQVQSFVEGMPELQGVGWLPTDGLHGDEDVSLGREIGPAQLAFLQYTSGSTGEPKGVMVSHRNILANQEMIHRAARTDAHTSFAGWLPLSHDMGLIGNVMQTIYLGSVCTLLSPATFLRDPLLWLKVISTYRVRVSGGPNFGYGLCVSRLARHKGELDLDLRSWRIAFVGAEPVRMGTLGAFAQAFAPYGFHPEAYLPCYGLAEATLIVSGTSGYRAPTAVEVAPAPGTGEASGVAGAPRSLVRCGPLVEGCEVAIVDPETGKRQPPGVEGELWIAGDHVAQGYWEAPEQSRATFENTLEGQGRYLRSGDLGFFSEGELVVSGRIKDLIVVRGHNHYPQDLETTVEAACPTLRPGCTAAFPVFFEGEERLGIVAEARPDAGVVDWTEVCETVRQAISEGHGLTAFLVAVVAARSVAKTTSGKVRRRETRRALLAGELELQAQSVLGAVTLPTLAAQPQERRSAHG